MGPFGHFWSVRVGGVSLHLCPSGSSSLGRARPCQGRGSGFEARLPLTRLPTLVSTAPHRATAEVDVVRVHHGPPELGRANPIAAAGDTIVVAELSSLSKVSVSTTAISGDV